MITDNKNYTFIPFKDTKEHIADYLAIATFCKALNIVGKMYYQVINEDKVKDIAAKNLQPVIIIHIEDYDIQVGGIGGTSKYIWLPAYNLPLEVLCSMRHEIVTSILRKQGIDTDDETIEATIEEATGRASEILMNMTKEEFNTEIFGAHNVRK